MTKALRKRLLRKLVDVAFEPSLRKPVRLVLARYLDGANPKRIPVSNKVTVAKNRTRELTAISASEGRVSRGTESCGKTDQPKGKE